MFQILLLAVLIDADKLSKFEFAFALHRDFPKKERCTSFESNRVESLAPNEPQPLVAGFVFSKVLGDDTSA